MAVSDEDYKLPNVTVLWDPRPRKGTSWAIYLADKLAYSQTKGRGPKVEKHFQRLCDEGLLPKRFRWRSYNAFPSTGQYVILHGTWPSAATDLMDVLASAGSLSVWESGRSVEP